MIMAAGTFKQPPGRSMSNFNIRGRVGIGFYFDMRQFLRRASDAAARDGRVRSPSPKLTTGRPGHATRREQPEIYVSS
jgi:hypothetical protein